MKQNGEKEENKKKGTTLVTKESVGAVGAIFTLIVGFLLFTGASVFGTLGGVTQNFLYGFMGVQVYFLLPLIFLISCAAFFGKSFLFGKRKLLFPVLFVLSCFLLAHAIATYSWQTDGYLKKCFSASENGWTDITPAGLIGGLIVVALKGVVDNVGAVLFCAIAVLFFGALNVKKLFGKSFFDLLRRGEKTKKTEPQKETANGARTIEKRENPLEQSVQATITAEQARTQSLQPPRGYEEPQPATRQQTEQYGAVNVLPSDLYREVEITQHPRVYLSNGDTEKDKAKEGGYSPFGQAFDRKTTPPPVTDGSKLFSGYSPKDSYNDNLYFDRNSSANRRKDAKSSAPVEDAPVSSYLSSYADSVNEEDVTPKITERKDSLSEQNAYENIYKDIPAHDMEREVEKPYVAPKERETSRETFSSSDYKKNASDVADFLMRGIRNTSSDREDPKKETEEENFAATREEPSPLATDNRRVVFDDEPKREIERDRNIFDDEPKRDFSSIDRLPDDNRYSARTGERDFESGADRIERRTDRTELDDTPLGGRVGFGFDDVRRPQESVDDKKENSGKLHPRLDPLFGERGSTRGENFGRDIFDGELSKDDRTARETNITDRGRFERDVDKAKNEPTEPVAPVVKPLPTPPPKPKVIRPFSPVPLDYFNTTESAPTLSPDEVEFTKSTIVETLAGFKVSATISSVTFGPTVTRYNVTIPRNILPQKVVSLDQSIAIALQAKSGVNIYPNYEDGAVSIEVPNKKRQFVQLGCMLTGDTYLNMKSTALCFAMGKDVGNKKVYGDLRKMTHVLVAGASGAGKSVFLRSVIISMIYRYSPSDLRLILIDPKKTEFVLYRHLPHLVFDEIITETGKTIQTLNWAIKEMNRRYDLFEEKTCRGKYVVNIDEYNANLEEGEKKLAKIVIIIDELADLMLAAKKEMEDRIQNITQKARAAGIHMILATQRPSIDVITGVIKSNLKTRVAFAVATDTDSRVILDLSGANKLLGNGDLMYTFEGTNTPIRVQSAFIDTPEAQRVIDYIRDHNDCDFDTQAESFINTTPSQSSVGAAMESDEEGGVEEVYIDALRIIILSGSASISMIQRKCNVGYNKAGKIVEWMEDMQYISPFDGAKSRRVLITKEQFESLYGPL